MGVERKNAVHFLRDAEFPENRVALPLYRGRHAAPVLTVAFRLLVSFFLSSFRLCTPISPRILLRVTLLTEQNFFV